MSPHSRDHRLKVSRRSLLRGSATLGAAASIAGRFSSSTPAVAAANGAETTEIAPGIFVHRGQHALIDAENLGDIANTSFVIGKDAVAVIDTGGSARVGQVLRRAIQAITDRPIRYVINTHMHPDHVLGNAAFEADKAEFIAHHKMARGLSARAERFLSRTQEQIGDDAFEGTKIILPTRVVDTSLTIDLGGRALNLVARSTAHTDNDLTIFDTQTETLFLGDLLFSEHVPTLDGSIVGWLKLIPILRSEAAQRVVPGHGPVAMAWPDALAPLEFYWSLIARDVRTAIQDGMTLSEATATVGQSERSKWQVFDEHHVRNVTAAFAELEWE
ncbi:MAG: MBL fold metallo-hydrolase [Hyphomicrobium sp.]|nr:MAG: MBL fold metallo-hydrolase [Hyphomicrobium sp.]